MFLISSFVCWIDIKLKNWSLLEIKQLQAYPVKKYLQTREYGSREVSLEEDLVS